MKEQMTMRKSYSSLQPDGDESWDVFDRIPAGAMVVVTLKRARNPEFLKRYWSVCSVAADFGKHWDDREDVDHWLKMHIPSMRKTYKVEADGTVYIRPRSIAIESMAAEAFEKFYERSMELLSVAIGTDIETLAEEVWDRKKRESQPR